VKFDYVIYDCCAEKGDVICAASYWGEEFGE
jgi:hypothetical protein